MTVHRVDPNEILDEVRGQLGDGFAAEDGTIRAGFEILGRGSRAAEIPGSGIGLSTCRKIVELYGGEITCRPSDVGATFTFTLPAA